MSRQQSSTRREFLGRTSPSESMRGASDTKSADLGDPSRNDGYLLVVSRQAMACTFEVHLPAVDRGTATQAAIAALDLVDRLEDQMTVYRDQSEIQNINRLAAFMPIDVEPQLFDLLVRAQEIAVRTGGAFDITSGPLSRAWGFSRRRGKLPTQQQLDAARTLVGYRYVHLDGDAYQISFTKEGVAINLNGIGKGYALDRAAALLREQGCEQFLLHGGNSSVLGSMPNDDECDAEAANSPDDAPTTTKQDRTPWRVGVRNPLQPQQRLAEIELTNGAVGTSGSGTQFFRHDKNRYGHIIDPRSGLPADGVLSATVRAPTAAEADALATAFYVMGPDAAREYCEQHPDIAAILICPPTSGRTPEVIMIGPEISWHQ